jgi:hypothetical protein
VQRAGSTIRPFFGGRIAKIVIASAAKQSTLAS